ncbi:MAG: phosphatase PAP2 family protein [Sphaerochaetaceae bacterium]|nr:phosphatase PAP2 family protein [Sphaerochaetaceae bacterium]
MKKLVTIFIVILMVFTLQAKSESPFALSFKFDFAALAVGIPAELIVKNLEPSFGKWDGTTLNKDDINFVDRFFAHGYESTPDNVSNVTAVISCISPALLLKDNFSDWKTIAVMYSETMLYTTLTCDTLKHLTSRNRPYMYFENKGRTDADRRYSFPSLHTAWAFAGATFTSYTYMKYNPDSKYNKQVAIATFSMAAITGALRIAAGKHFLTDVLSGAAIGALWGYGVPKLHELKAKANNKVLDALEVAPGYVGFNIAL